METDFYRKTVIHLKLCGEHFAISDHSELTASTNMKYVVLSLHQNLNYLQTQQYLNGTSYKNVNKVEVFSRAVTVEIIS